jgi:hypothetical protein
MASPLQIILNDNDYQQARDAGGGGPKKDFFADRDREFRAHKAALINQLGAITHTLESQTPTQGNIGYIKVILRREAWAKSHRPTSALFRPDRISLVGGGDLGEMYFEADPKALRGVAKEISGAEEETRHKLDKARNKMVPNPSPARSETGAIERIELYGPRDRRSFSVEEAVAWLARPMTGSAYQIELFDMPPPHSQLDAFSLDRQKLYSSFLRGLAANGDGLTVQRLSMREKAQPFISARLGRSAQPPTILLDSIVPPDHKRASELIPFDQSVERHRRLLNFLDHHPLVRHIDLPPIVVRNIDGEMVSARAAAGEGRVRPSDLSVPTRNSARTYPRMGVIDGGISPELNDWVIDRWDLLDSADVDHAHGTFIGGLAVAGNTLNGNAICSEPDGIEIVDVAVYPDEQKTTAFSTYYPDGVTQFFDEIEYAIADAKARHGVRVFNMSLNIQHPAQPDRYSAFAARADQIAEANDAILFLSSGNTAPQDLRPEWPCGRDTGARESGICPNRHSIHRIFRTALLMLRHVILGAAPAYGPA